MRAPGFHPFTGGLVRDEVAAEVVSPPYDALTVEQRAEARTRRPLSYLSVLLDSRDLPDGDHLAAGREAVERLLTAGVFETRPPAVYACRLAQDDHAQLGVVGEVPLAWVDEGRVLSHEQTKPPRAAELALHVEAVGVTSSPVVLAHRTDRDLERTLARAVAAPALRSFRLDDGLRVELWALDAADQEVVVDRLDRARLYITDGHHRIEAARRLRLGREDEPGPHQHILAAVFGEAQLRVEPFHRVVAAGGVDVERALAAVGRLVPSPRPPRPDRQGTFGVAWRGRWYRLEVAADPDELGPAVLQRAVLGPVFGVEDPAQDRRLETVAGTTPPDEVARRAEERDGVAFLLRPVSVAQLMVRADQGRTLPPKSTYFVPKMRSGIFLRPFG